jgi:hypothetical protein
MLHSVALSCAAVAHQHAVRKQSASAVSNLTVAAATARLVCHANLKLVAEFGTPCVLHTCTHIQLNDRVLSTLNVTCVWHCVVCLQEYEQPMPGLLYEAELSGSGSSSSHRADSADQQQQRRQIREQNSLSDYSGDVPIVDPEGPGVGLITASSVTVSGITVDSVTADSSSAGDAAAAAAAAAHTSCEGATLLDKSAHTAATTATADGAGSAGRARGTTIDIGSGVVLRRSSSSGAHSDQYDDDEHEHKSMKVCIRSLLIVAPLFTTVGTSIVLAAAASITTSTSITAIAAGLHTVRLHLVVAPMLLAKMCCSCTFCITGCHSLALATLCSTLCWCRRLLFTVSFSIVYVLQCSCTDKTLHQYSNTTAAMLLSLCCH